MCDTPNCVTFKDLEVYNVNGENFKNFLENVVSVGDDFISSDVVFENVIIEEGVYSSAINDHPSETLVDTSSEIFLNSGLVVNGTVFINNDLNIGGLFNGVVPDKNHLLLYEGDQRIDGG